MTKHILLVEIGTEELPPKMLRKFGESFAKNIQHEFKIFNIIYKKILWFASCRRLAIKVISIVFDAYNIDNNFITSNISTTQFDKDEVLFNEHYLLKEDIISILYNIVNNALLGLPVSTMMKWGREDIRFIRPVHTVTILLDDKVVLCNFFGISSNRVIRGHRFMGDKEIILKNADQYEETLLKKGFVVADYEERKHIIRHGVDSIAKEIGGIVDYTGNLLEEVTGLFEWPIVLFGSFDKNFLHIPCEILLYIMKVQKKYFPLYDFKGKMLPYFIFVIDIITNNNKQIIIDHEKVLHLSFSEVKFFWSCDEKYFLEGYVSRLHTILFHKKLGSLYDKSIRIRNLSSWVASEININIYQVERAAILSKCDLLSNVVAEFPFAQGIIGMYYALRDGEEREVALAQKEQYQPKFSSDSLPSTDVSCVLSIVDKMDTITGMFIIGEHSKGNRDPMGLRRATVGILRIIIEKKININLWNLVEQSLSLYKNFSSDGFARKIIDFMYKRLCVLYKKKGYRIDIIQAILSDTLENLTDFDGRINAVSSFCLLKESRLLFIMYKRIYNILQSVPDVLKEEIDHSLLVEKDEIYLARKILTLNQELKLLYEMGNYYDALNLLVGLYNPLEQFFRHIIVLSDNKDLRLNRLILLNKIWLLLLRIMNSPRYTLDVSSFTK